MAIADDDLRWSAVNEALCLILERSETELVGQRFDAFVHPDDVETANQPRRRRPSQTRTSTGLLDEAPVRDPEVAASSGRG